MNTALGRRLSPTQYEKLVSAVCARRKEVVQAQECQEWTTRRERYERIAAGDHWYRLSCNGYNGAVPGGGGIPQIFDRINETLGIIQSVRRFLVARVCKDLFGSRPYFYVQPEGAIEQDLAQGHAAVIQIVSTGEALMERRLAELPTEEWNDVRVDITPREYVLDPQDESGEI